MEIQITAIKFETVNGKKTGKSFAFKLDPKKMAVYKTEATVRKRVEEYVAKSGVFKSSELKDLKYSMKDFLEEWKKQVEIVQAEELAKLEASPNNPDSRITPDMITRLAPNEVFVFGSNEQGLHYGGAAIYVDRDELAYYEQFRKDNHLTTVLLPVALDTLEPIEDGLFLDPDTLQPVDLDALNEKNNIHTMSGWEANAMACFETCNYIFQNGYQIICFTNHPGAYPQIEAYKPDGSKCFIITNAVAVSNKDAEQTIDVKLASSLQESYGFFVNRVYSNKWNTLDFDEVELLRQGGHYSNEIELLSLSEINEHWPNIHLNISYIPD